ncbi:hypothetical protein [Embleya sp. MST-111070]|uniref:hypothetical protein n=1 Tax=Embleya sp. MST-111070 TaxID=3398231 RepID=UPI003F7397C5
MTVTPTTDHPAWTTDPTGARVRLLDTGSGLWLATFDPGEGLRLDVVTGEDDPKPAVTVTEPDELPAVPKPLNTALKNLGTVVRIPNPSLWEAISTAILRQVVRAAQARRIHHAWCTTHGPAVETTAGRLSTAPGPETVLALSEDAFKNVGALFHRTALQAAAHAYLQHGDRWRALPAGALVEALDEVPRIGPWTAAAAAADFTGDFSIYPHHDLAVRTWARRIAPDHPWPATEKEFGTHWRRWARNDRQLHALTLFTLTWGTSHADQRQYGGTTAQH